MMSLPHRTVPNTSINSIRANLWPQIVPGERRAESPFKGRRGQTIWNTTWRLATPEEQQRLREEKAAQDDIPF